MRVQFALESLSSLRRNPCPGWRGIRRWGNHWGIFALSQLDFQSIRYHFRSLIRVYDETGKRYLFFRYYDPRVLLVFLPSCQGAQLADLFGPVDFYLAEGGQGAELHRYAQEAGKLVATMVGLPKAG
jgi:hypothetical protein